MTTHTFAVRRTDATTRRLGTFSYLPPLTPDQLRGQVEYMLTQGWACSVEHVEQSRASDQYWYMWGLPLFGTTSADTVLEAVAACRTANPGDHVRLIGYDSTRQTQGLALVIRGD